MTNSTNNTKEGWRSFFSGLIKGVIFIAFYLAGLGTSALMEEQKIDFLESETIRQQVEIDQLKAHRTETAQIQRNIQEMRREINELKAEIRGSK